jgi:hypothetical protein
VFSMNTSLRKPHPSHRCSFRSVYRDEISLQWVVRQRRKGGCPRRGRHEQPRIWSLLALDELVSCSLGGFLRFIHSAGWALFHRVTNCRRTRLGRWLLLPVESAFLSCRKGFIPKALWAKPIYFKKCAGFVDFDGSGSTLEWRQHSAGSSRMEFRPRSKGDRPCDS